MVCSRMVDGFVSERVHFLWFNYLSVILDPLLFITMDGVLYASMHILDVDDCSMPHVCENASMKIYPHNCDDMLLESLDVVDIPNDKIFKKNAIRSFKRI